MSKVYIIVGSAYGDFDMSYEWNVKGFIDKEMADARAQELNSIASAYTEENCMTVDAGVREKVETKLKKLDPKVSMGNYGVTYKVETLGIEL